MNGVIVDYGVFMTNETDWPQRLAEGRATEALETVRKTLERALQELVAKNSPIQSIRDLLQSPQTLGSCLRGAALQNSEGA